MKIFTKEELAEYNGQNGAPAYIAFAGKVYDVTGSPFWKNGIHQGRHKAGMDLTAAMADAPHGAHVLSKFPVVGEL